MVNIGDNAPSLTVKLTDQEKTNENFKLSQAYSRPNTTIFYFFPAIFTGVCTESSCKLRDDIEEFEELDANVYGISTDLPFSQKVFIEKNDINYPILSDWNKEMIAAFNVVDNNFGDFRGVAKRSLFAIRNGKVIYKWVAEHPGKYPPFEELKRTIKP